MESEMNPMKSTRSAQSGRPAKGKLSETFTNSTESVNVFDAFKDIIED